MFPEVCGSLETCFLDYAQTVSAVFHLLKAIALRYNDKLLSLVTAGSTLFLLGTSLTCVYAETAGQGKSVPQSLTLQTALQLATENNPQLKAARAKLLVQDAQSITAKTRLNPTLISDNGIAEKTYRVGIEQTIELGGKRQKRMAISDTSRQILIEDINTLALDIRTSVRNAYTQLFVAQQKQSMLNAIVSTVEQLLTIATKREKAGDISQLDVLQAEVALVSAQNDLEQARYNVVEARNTLNSLLSQSLQTSLQLVPPNILESEWRQNASDTAEEQIEALFQKALTHRPEMLKNAGTMLQATQQEALAKANRIPNLSVTAGPDMVTGSDGSLSAFIIGNVQLPVFDRQQGPIQEAMARHAQLKDEKDALKNRIYLEVANAFNRLLASQKQVKRYEKELLPKGETISIKSRRSFEVGKSAIALPIMAQQAYINTQLRYLQVSSELQSAYSDLERAVGTDL
jgi:outer membrane protein, heavy metal efflux system